MHVSQRLPWLRIAGYASIVLGSFLLYDHYRLVSVVVDFASAVIQTAY